MKKFGGSQNLKPIYLTGYEECFFKPRTYEKAALSSEALQEDSEDIYVKNGLEGLCQLPELNLA